MRGTSKSKADILFTHKNPLMFSGKVGHPPERGRFARKRRPQKYDMIVTAGALLGDDTLAVAKANPTTKFAIVDYAYDKRPANLTGLVFRAIRTRNGR